MLDRPPPDVPFSDAALKATLVRLEGEWDDYQSTRGRDGIYGFLTAIFEVAAWWMQARKANEYGRRALKLHGHPYPAKSPEPFATLILSTADREKVDDRTRSKWSRVLQYAAEYKDLDEPLRDFIKRKGGLNACASRYARRLGRYGKSV